MVHLDRFGLDFFLIIYKVVRQEEEAKQAAAAAEPGEDQRHRNEYNETQLCCSLLNMGIGVK